MKKPEKKVVKKQYRGLIAPAVVLAGSVLVAVIGIAEAQGKLSFWDIVADLTAQKIADKVESPALTDGAFGGTDLNRGVTTFDQLALTENDAQAVNVRAWDFGYIGDSSSSFHLGPMPFDVNLLLGSSYLWLDGTTSATTFFSMGTSTNAEAPDYNAATANRPTSAFDRIVSVTGTLNKVIATTTAGILRVPKNHYLNVFMTTGGSNALHGASVTSTAGRGFTSSSYYSFMFERVTTSTP